MENQIVDHNSLGFKKILFLFVIFVILSAGTIFMSVSNKQNKTVKTQAASSDIKISAWYGSYKGSMTRVIDNTKGISYFHAINSKDGSVSFTFTVEETGDYELSANVFTNKTYGNKFDTTISVVGDEEEIYAPWDLSIENIKENTWKETRYTGLDSLFVGLEQGKTYIFTVKTKGNDSVGPQISSMSLQRKGNNLSFDPPITLVELSKLLRKDIIFPGTGKFTITQLQNIRYFYGVIPTKEIQDLFIDSDKELPAVIGEKKTYILKPWQGIEKDSKKMFVPNGIGSISAELLSILPSGDVDLRISGTIQNAQPKHVYRIELNGYGYILSGKGIVRVNNSGSGEIQPFIYRLYTQKSYKQNKEYRLNKWRPMTSIILYEDDESSPFIKTVQISNAPDGTANYTTQYDKNTVCASSSTPCFISLFSTNNLEESVKNFDILSMTGNNIWPLNENERGIFIFSSINTKAPDAKATLIVEFIYEYDPNSEMARLNNGKTRDYDITGKAIGLIPGKKYRIFIGNGSGYGSAGGTYKADSQGSINKISAATMLGPNEKVKMIMIAEEPKPRTPLDQEVCTTHDPCLKISLN